MDGSGTLPTLANLEDVLATPDVLAKTAREKLAQALNALQNDADTPDELLELAEPIAQTMGILHKIERSGGQNLEGRDQVLANVKTALGKLQTMNVSHSALDAVMEHVAGCLSSVHQLARAQQTQVMAQPVAPAPAPAPVAVAVAPAPPPPAPAPAPAPVAAAPIASPLGQPPRAPVSAPLQHQPPASPTSSGVGPSVPQAISSPPAFAFAPPSITAPLPNLANLPPPQPAQVTPVAPVAPQPAAQTVSLHHPVLQPEKPVLDKAGTQAIGPDIIAAAAAASGTMHFPPAPASSPARAPVPAPASNPGLQGGGTMRMPDPRPAQAAPVSAARPVPPSAGRPAPSSGATGNVVVELGTHSTSNFYKGLSGNDVIEHGGIFVATYKIPKLGVTVNLRVLLPGDYEFQATGVVQWIREAGSSGDSEPGFGARFTHIAQDGKQLVYRYTRNREPMFYDDL